MSNDNIPQRAYIVTKYKMYIEYLRNIINLSLHNKKYLIFYEYFNKKIIISQNIIKLVFGECYDKKIKIPHNIIFLKIGIYFNQKLKLPTKIKHLVLNEKFNKKIKLP